MKNKKTSKALQEIAKLTVTSLKLFNLLPGYRNYTIHSNKKLLEKHNKDKIKAIQKLSGAVEKTGRKIKGGNKMELTPEDIDRIRRQYTMEDKRQMQDLEFTADRKELKGGRSWRVTLDNIHKVEYTEIKSKVEVTNSMLSQEKTIELINKGMEYIRKLFDEEVEKYQYMYMSEEKHEEESAQEDGQIN